jgi:hypothetical protein
MNFNGKPHKQDGIYTESCGHLRADDTGILLHILNGSQWKTPIGYWPPKMSAHQIAPEFRRSQL